MPALVLAASMAAGSAVADPLVDFAQACSEPAARACEARRREDRRAPCGAEVLLSASCADFLGGLAGLAKPTPDQRLVLIRGRTWVLQAQDALGDRAESELCGERQALAQDHPDYGEVWYELALRCTEGVGEKVALLEKALVVDPTNASALRFLTGLVEHTGDHLGIEPRRLVRYQTTGYETSSDDWMRITYATRIYQTSLEFGDVDTAKAIRERLRRDVLDTLDYRGERGAESVDLACSTFHIGLGERCIAAFESLALGGELTDDVVRLLPHLLSALRRKPDELVLDGSPLPIDAAARDEYIARLGRAMEALPVGLRSSEYHRVHAGFLQGPERIAALRRAVAADYGNADAKCALGGALMSARAYGEAWEIYSDMVATDERRGSCDPHAEIAKAGKPLGLVPR